MHLAVAALFCHPGNGSSVSGQPRGGPCISQSKNCYQLCWPVPFGGTSGMAIRFTVDLITRQWWQSSIGGGAETPWRCTSCAVYFSSLLNTILCCMQPMCHERQMGRQTRCPEITLPLPPPGPGSRPDVISDTTRSAQRPGPYHQPDWTSKAWRGLFSFISPRDWHSRHNGPTSVKRDDI